MIKVDKDGTTTEVWFDDKGRRCESTTKILNADEISALEKQIKQGQVMTLEELDDFIENKKRFSIILMFLHPVRTLKRLKAFYEGEEVSLM